MEGRLRDFSQEWQKTFLGSGGSIKVVVDMIFRVARSQDQLAGRLNGAHLWGYPYKEEISAPPCCPYDREFEFVQGMCGY